MDTLGKVQEIQHSKVEEFSYPEIVSLTPNIKPDNKIEAERKLPPFSRLKFPMERFNGGQKWVEYTDRGKAMCFTKSFELYKDIVNMKNEKWLIKKLSDEGFNMSPNVSKKTPVLRMIKPGTDDIILFIQGE